MSQTITSDNGVEITVGLLALEVTDPVSAIGVYARLSPGQRCALADALRGREPGDEYVDWKAMYEQAVQERDALNAHHPKPQPYDQGGVRGVDSLLYRAERAERERDAAAARAEQAEDQWKKWERKADQRDELLIRTEAERDAAAARAEQAGARVRLANQQSVEWEGEAERLLCERDEWKARAEAAEQLIPAYAMLDIWMALGRDSIHFDDWYDKHGYADAWAELTSAVREARTAPAVTRDEIGNALMRVGVSNGVETHTEVSVGTDAVWSLVSGADPAVHVVRESQIAAVEVERGAKKWIADGEATSDVGNGPEWLREPIGAYLKWVADAEAVARAIAAEQAVDPVEELAEQIETATRAAIRQACDDLAGVVPALDPLAVEQAMEVRAASRKVAAHVLGQEATR